MATFTARASSFAVSAVTATSRTLRVFFVGFYWKLREDRGLQVRFVDSEVKGTGRFKSLALVAKLIC
ncbi:hypothetical protein WS54_03070 [Burkholderia sp. NRF60-BP8]|nr:hypothetical protein WS54_03070 [Burkholderia sp. NRF60-BP8]KVA07876.1 hypothetical protein WS54_27535 [Burkholderia sp. NRF60-BP8]